MKIVEGRVAATHSEDGQKLDKIGKQLAEKILNSNEYLIRFKGKR